MEIKKYESENQFEIANELLSQYNDLRKIEIYKMKTEIKQRQLKERNEIEKAQIAESTSLNTEMDKKFLELEKKWSESREKMMNEHKKEIEDKIYWFNNHISHIPKPSSEILNYQRILKGIVKQKNYEKANELHNLLNSIKYSEKRKWDVVREKKLKFEIDTLKGKHEVDILNFDVRHKKSISDFKKNRNYESEKFVQKYRNKFKELEQNHKIELGEFKNINIFNAKQLSGEISRGFNKNRLFSSTDNPKQSNKL